jgi:hypothetical protein
LTDGHPAELIDAQTAKGVSVGTTAEEVLRDGEYLRIGIKITDAATIRKVQDGKRELSVGYTSEIEWGDGIAPDGTPFQARQTNIIGNHIAIVDAGRAGPLARIGDGQPGTLDGGKDRKPWGASPLPITDRKDTLMSDALTTVVLGDAAAQVAVADAPKIEAFKTASNKAFADAQSAHETVIAAKDAEMATKDAKIAELEKSAITDADLDAKVAARAELIGKAKTIAKDVATVGLSDGAIRKAAVVLVLGDTAIAGKSEAYTDAMFDILLDKASKADPVAAALNDGVVIVNDARSEFIKNLSTAYLNTAKGA